MRDDLIVETPDLLNRGRGLNRYGLVGSQLVAMVGTFFYHGATLTQAKFRGMPMNGGF